MTATEQAPTALDHALALARHGFRVLPIKPGEKRPPMAAWQEAASAEEQPIRAWFNGIYRSHGVGIATGHLATGSRFFVLDIDDREHHSGTDTLEQLEDKHGKLPDTVRSITGSGGAHLFFAVPFHRLCPRNDQSGRLGPGLDIRGEGGQVVVSPTVHPNGQQYCWEIGHGPGRIPMAEAPTWLLDLLEHDTVVPRDPFTHTATRDPFIGLSPADRYNDTHTWDQILTNDGWTLSHARDGEDYYTRPGKETREGISATVGWQGNDALKVFTSSVPWLIADRTYSKFQYYALRHHNGNESAAARAILATEHNTPRNPVTPPSPAPAGLSETFWDERPALAHIRQAARARLVAPAAVLGAVLARVAAFTPPSTCLPPTVGGNAPLSLYIALRGNSGDGKSSPVATATDLIPGHPPTCIGPLALGSGEGLVEAFMDLVEETVDDGTGKVQKRKVKKQVKHGALFNLDEGQLLSEIGSRKGATILPVLRTAWSGGDPGQANASIETRRSLKPGTYAVGIISLWQDKAAVALLADADGGTPQRFVWLDVADPHATINRPEWPGPLTWKPPALIAFQGVISPNPLKLDPAIELEIAEARVAHVRRDIISAPLDAHRRLNKLKVAGVLTVLDERETITEDDWRLAEHIMATSDQTRDWVIAEAQRRTADETAGRISQVVLKETVAEKSAIDRALARAIKSVYRAVERGGGQPVSKRAIHAAIASRDRHHVTTDEAIAEAERLNWIVPRVDGWQPGEAKPA